LHGSIDGAAMVAGEVEERFRQTTGDVEEGKIGGQVTGAPDAASQGGEQVSHDLRVELDEVEKVAAPQNEGVHLLDGLDGGRAGLAVDEGKLAEAVARTEE